MKIYFTASLAGKNKYEKEYVSVVEYLKEIGSQVSEHILGVSKELTKRETPEEKVKVYKELTKMLKMADVMVAEISYPSINVGHEIALALESNKPVLALHLKGTNIGLLEGNVDERLRMVEYSMKSLKKVIKAEIEKIQGQSDIRFNFFIPPAIVAYLDWLSRKRRLPRSVYLRNLLEEKMKADLEFQEETNSSKTS